MSEPRLAVAKALLLHGLPDGERLQRAEVLKHADVRPRTFASSAAKIGAVMKDPQSRFFDVSRPGYVSFGPGAGLAIGVSVSTQTVHATLVDANGWRRAEH